MAQTTFFRLGPTLTSRLFLSVYPLLGALALATAPVSADPQATEPSSNLRIKSVELVASSLMPRSLNPDRSLVSVTIDSAGLTNATLRLKSADWPQPATKQVSVLSSGKQVVEVETAVFKTPVTVSCEIEVTGGKKEFAPATIQPARNWTVYLTQHTHTDIGYTRPQTEILPEHLRYIDYALDFCDLTDGYPDDARFRWTCETSWAVREYLKDRPAKQIERLKKRVAEGRIELCGLMLNMSEIASESSLASLLAPLRMMKDDFGFTVPTAMQNDVNGAGWCLVDYFQDIGIRYLTMGVNQTRSILPFDKPTPFWWESPAGKRILAYRADHYHLGNMWHIQDGDPAKLGPYLEKYLASLVKRGYAFDRISVQFSGYHTDNSPPSSSECDLVRQWNETYAWPKLRLSTSREFLAYVEKEHSAELPVHRQAWPDWWTDGFGSAARETAAARETDTAMQVNYGVLAIASMLGAEIKPQTMQRAAAIQDDLLFYQEHTYGAAESIDDPLAENTQVQWGEKSSYVWKAVMNSHLLREEALGLAQDFLPRAEVPTIAVFNTLNWDRSGLIRVFIDHQMLPPDREFRILDGDQTVPAQALERRSEGTYWALWVSDVPSLGFKILRIETSDKPRSKPAEAPDALALENRFYRLVMDPTKAAIKSLVDKESGQELVDQEATFALGQCIYETMPNRREMKPDIFKRTTVRNGKVKPGANGPIWKSLAFAADMDGCTTNNGIRGEVRLYETEKRIELHYAMRKLPIRSPEAVYVAFPFHVPNGKMRYEAQGGMVTPGEDQIPGSSSDWQTLQSFLGVHGPEESILMGSEEAPLVQLGDFNLGKWQRVTRVEKPHVYSWVMNNYWFTNFRTEQEGEFKWHYYLTSVKENSPMTDTRFGWGCRVPFATRVLPPGKASGSGQTRRESMLSSAVPNVVVVQARPCSDGQGLFLHLREVEGKRTTISASDVTAAVPLRGMDQVSVLEEVLRSGLESITLEPYEVKFVRLQF